MVTKKQIKEWKLLRSKKYRLQQNKFIAEGEKIVDEIIDLMPPSLIYVLCTDSYASRLTSSQLRGLNGKLLTCDQATLDAISALTTPTSVMAIMHLPSPEESLITSKGLSLYLDGLRDPGNLGAILRIADWFGVRGVYLSDDCVDAHNPKTIQASMGAFLRVDTQTVSLEAIQSGELGLQCIGTKIDGGEDAMSFDWPESTLLVIGSESHGVRSSSQSHISKWVSIPRGSERSGSESLNAAVATGILCASYTSRGRAES